MGVLESVIEFLQFEMKEPDLYGWFHLLCLGIMIVLIALLSLLKIETRKLLLVFSLVMITLELYKQLSFSHHNGVWEYQWYAFPFQFCSVPMYAALIAAITKNRKVEQALLCFLATYGLVAGIAVMAYPSTVFISETLINVQTMIHHGFMVVMGMHLIISRKVTFGLKTILNAACVFVILVIIALLANIITYHAGIDGGLELFYISPYHSPILPVFSVIYEKAPYVVLLLSYVIIFTVGSMLPLFISRLFLKKSK